MLEMIPLNCVTIALHRQVLPDVWPVPRVASLTGKENQVELQVSYPITTKAPGSAPLVSHSCCGACLGHSSPQTLVLDPAIHLLLTYMRNALTLHDEEPSSGFPVN